MKNIFIILFCSITSFANAQTLVGTTFSGKYFSLSLENYQERLLSEENYKGLLIKSKTTNPNYYNNSIQLTFGSSNNSCNSCDTLVVASSSKIIYFTAAENVNQRMDMLRIYVNGSNQYLYKISGSLIIQDKISNTYKYVKQKASAKSNCSFMGLTYPLCGYQLPVGVINNNLLIHRNKNKFLGEIKRSYVCLIDLDTGNEKILKKDCFNPSISPDGKYILVELSNTKNRSYKIYDVLNAKWLDNIEVAVDMFWLYQ
jgi:hypothetical protein